MLIAAQVSGFEFAIQERGPISEWLRNQFAIPFYEAYRKANGFVQILDITPYVEDLDHLADRQEFARRIRRMKVRVTGVDSK